MNLPSPAPAYDQTQQQFVQREIEAADAANVKQGGNFEVQNGRIIFTDTVDGSRWYLTVASGVLTPVAL